VDLPSIVSANPSSSSSNGAPALAPASGSLAVPAVPAAPPEAIALDIGSVKTAFQAAGQARFLDLSGRFSFDDRAKINTAVNELSQKTGSKVWVLALPGKTDVNAYASIHAELKMQQKDVLLIFSADKRHLHSQAIPKTIGNEILKETNTAFYKTSPANGVLQMLDAVATRLSNAAPSTSSSTGAPPVAPGAAKKSLPLDGILVVVAIAVIGWMLFRSKTPRRPAPPKVAAKPRPPKEPAESIKDDEA